MLTKPCVASVSLFDLMPSPPDTRLNEPSAIFTQSRPRRQSSTAVTFRVPPVTTKSSFEQMPWQ